MSCKFSNQNLLYNRRKIFISIYWTI